MVDSSSSATQTAALQIDPSTKSLARVYVSALLDARSENSAEEKIAELRSFLDDVLSVHPDFERLLLSPRVSQGEKTALLERAVAPQASPFFAGFLKVLAERDRLDLLRPIYAMAVAELEHRQGKRRAIVRAAAPLSDDQLERVRQRLAEILSADPVLHVEIDPSLLGGLVIQVGDTVYDSSLRNRLGQLQSQLRQRYVHEIQSGRDRFSYTEGS